MFLAKMRMDVQFSYIVSGFQHDWRYDKQNKPMIEVATVFFETVFLEYCILGILYSFVQSLAKIIQPSSMIIFSAADRMTVHSLSGLSSRKRSDANLKLEGMFVHSSVQQH